MDSFYEVLGERIKHYRKLTGMTLESLGEKIGVGKSTVRKYETGMIRIDHDRLLKIADVLGIDVSLLYGESIESETVDVPLYGNISCGSGSVIYDTPEQHITSPKDWVNGDVYFYVKAVGDSMTGAKVNEGDLLLIRKQIDLEEGQIGAVVINDEVFLKRVYKNNGKFTLVSENPEYPPVIFNPRTDDHIRIIGKLEKAITEF